MFLINYPQMKLGTAPSLSDHHGAVAFEHSTLVINPVYEKIIAQSVGNTSYPFWRAGISGTHNKGRLFIFRNIYLFNAFKR